MSVSPPVSPSATPRSWSSTGAILSGLVATRLDPFKDALSRIEEKVSGTIQKTRSRHSICRTRQTSKRGPDGFLCPWVGGLFCAGTTTSDGRPAKVNQSAPLVTGFSGFEGSRFSKQLSGVQPLRQWLADLPAADPKRRFSRDSLRGLLAGLEEKLGRTQRAEWFAPDTVLQRVLEDGKEPLPATLRDEIISTTLSPLSEEHTLALLVYSAELYVDADKKVRAPYQLYGELNRVCREYGHAAHPNHDLQAEWELFQPLAMHINAAINALPSVSALLYRGAGYTVDASAYSPGMRGAWGGFVSASSDRRQAVSFVSHQEGLRASCGSYFIIFTDQARPIYHISEFPSEMEYLHPLDLELEVCMVVPFYLLTRASVNVAVVVLKRSGAEISLQANLRVLSSLAFVMDDFATRYVLPTVKADGSMEGLTIDNAIQQFLDGPDHTLLVSGQHGSGKSSCAMWLAMQPEYEGWTFLFICVGCSADPFAPGVVARSLNAHYGIGERAFAELLNRRFVVIIDNLYADPTGRPTLHDANGFSKVTTKILLLCRAKQVADFRAWSGAGTSQVLLQPFSDEDVEQFVALHVTGPDPEAAARRPTSLLDRRVSASTASSLRRPSTGPVEERLLRQLRRSPIASEYWSPALLHMATELFLADPCALESVPSLFAFHIRWLEWYLAARGSDDVAGDVQRTEALAWEVQLAGGYGSPIGPRGAEDWFRRLPLMVPSYDPAYPFIFMHQSLREALLARFVWRRLTQSADVSFLSEGALHREPNFLRYFGEIYRSGDGAPLRDTVRQRLKCVAGGAPGAPRLEVEGAASAAALLQAIGR